MSEWFLNESLDYSDFIKKSFKLFFPCWKTASAFTKGKPRNKSQFDENCQRSEDFHQVLQEMLLTLQLLVVRKVVAWLILRLFWILKVWKLFNRKVTSITYGRNNLSVPFSKCSLARLPQAWKACTSVRVTFHFRISPRFRVLQKTYLQSMVSKIYFQNYHRKQYLLVWKAAPYIYTGIHFQKLSPWKLNIFIVSKNLNFQLKFVCWKKNQVANLCRKLFRVSF